DVHTVTVSWGPGEGTSTITLPVGQRTFTLTHQHLDDGASTGLGHPADVYSDSVVVTDDDTGSATIGTSLTFNNVAPVVGAVSNSSPDVGGADEGQTVTATVAFTDVGTLDAHSLLIDWGDGSTPTSFA